MFMYLIHIIWDMGGDPNMKNDEMNDQPDDEASDEPKPLPTWIDIIRVSRYLHSYEPALEMMQRVENRGHGSSVERELLNLVVNYNFSDMQLKGRILDMLYGEHHKMYSYQGWDTLKVD